MDFKVTFSKSALRDLEEIVRFIARDDPIRARNLGDKLLDKALSLRLFPHRHALFPHRDNIRKVPMPPYLIYYRINEAKGRVTILHFWHGARQNPFM
jgi:plasmid stabilization system protein ParE